MTKPDPRSARRLTVCLLLALLTACNTTPDRPPPPPIPRAEPAPPPTAPTAPQADSEPRQTPSTAAADAAADADAVYAPPSADAAEVEFEEIPVDENGEPMRPVATAAAPAPTRQAAVDGAAGGGNDGADGSTPLARMNDTIAARERARDSNAGGAAAPTPAADPDLVGPRMAVGALTTDEHIAAVDAELEAGLQAFDERLQRARAAAAAERARSAAGGAAYGAEDGRGQGSERPPEGGSGGAAATGTGLGQTPDLSGTSSGTAPPRVVGTAPAGLPDGRDDDIVARQLREAASSERDPVLQAKLWEEYRKYKAGQ